MIVDLGDASMRPRWKLYIGLFFACSCSSNNDHHPTASEAKGISDAHLEETFPQIQRKRLAASVHDGGDRWIVTYSRPKGAVGPDFSVEIDKKSGIIVKGLRGPCYVDARSGWKRTCEFGEFGTSERAFSVLDPNKSGIIEGLEWKSFSDRQTANLKSEDDDMKRDYRTQLAMLFAELDADADGEVSKAEWDQSQLIRFDTQRQ